MTDESVQHDAAVEPAGELEPGELEASGTTEAEQARIEELRSQVEENWSKYLRAMAELENMRKRNARELENARKFGAERLASAILPVRDSLEAALAAAAGGEPAGLDVATILEGEQATLRLLDQALTEAGIREIDPHGEPFDPNKHEAITVQPSDAAEPDTVLEVVQKGYEINDRLLRPARVIVAKTP